MSEQDIMDAANQEEFNAVKTLDDALETVLLPEAHCFNIQCKDIDEAVAILNHVMHCIATGASPSTASSIEGVSAVGTRFYNATAQGFSCAEFSITL